MRGRAKVKRRATYVGLRAYCMAVAVCKRVLPVGVWVMGCAFNGALQTQGATCVVWLVVEVGRGHSRRKVRGCLG